LRENVRKCPVTRWKKSGGDQRALKGVPHKIVSGKRRKGHIGDVRRNYHRKRETTTKGR